MIGYTAGMAVLILAATTSSRAACPPGTLGTGEICYNGNNSYTTIQAAVNACPPGGIIYLGPGTYSISSFVYTYGETIIGSGVGQTFITTGTAAYGFLWTDSATPDGVAGGLQNVTILSTATASTMFVSDPDGLDVFNVDLLLTGSGAGISSILGSGPVSVDQCNIYNSNTGIYARSDLTVTDTTVADSAYAGIYVSLADADVVIENTVVRNSGVTSAYYGQGIKVEPAASLTVRNCDVLNNAGDGIKLFPVGYVGTADISNTIIAGNGNYGVRQQLPALATYTNNLFYGNTPANFQEYLWAHDTATEINSPINYYTGSVTVAVNNIVCAPNFVDEGASEPDLHLSPGSCALDAGVANALTADLEGNPRPSGTGVDIGAYELTVVTCDCPTITTAARAAVCGTSSLTSFSAVLAIIDAQLVAAGCELSDPCRDQIIAALGL